MKSIKYTAILILFFAGLVSCEEDNYDYPSETFIDAQTKEPYQIAIGNTGIRITMMELLFHWKKRLLISKALLKNIMR